MLPWVSSSQGLAEMQRLLVPAVDTRLEMWTQGWRGVMETAWGCPVAAPFPLALVPDSPFPHLTVNLLAGALLDPICSLTSNTTLGKRLKLPSFACLLPL